MLFREQLIEEFPGIRQRLRVHCVRRLCRRDVTTPAPWAAAERLHPQRSHPDPHHVEAVWARHALPRDGLAAHDATITSIGVSMAGNHEVGIVPKNKPSAALW